MQNGGRGGCKIAVFDTRTRTSFRAKGLPPPLQNRNFTSAFDTRTSFRVKGLPPSLQNRPFASAFDTNFILCERVAASCRLVGIARGPKREKKNKERDRDRGQREREKERKREGREGEAEREREDEKM